MKIPVGVIDCTPSWANIVNALIAVMQDGTAEGQAIAIEQLRNMAKVADLYVEAVTPVEATNFDVRISTITAWELMRPITIKGRTTCLADEYGILIMDKDYGEHDENLYNEDGTKQWVGVQSSDFEDFQPATDGGTYEIWLQTASEYHHSEFKAELAAGNYKDTAYTYFIDEDTDNGVFTLCIHNQKNKCIGEYNYPEASEAEDDIKAATEQYKFTFTKL